MGKKAIKINGLCLVLLDDLNKLGSATGCELAKVAKNVSHQQIYREIKKLKDEANVLTMKKVPQDGKPDKKVYAISDHDSLIAAFIDGIKGLSVTSDISPHDIEAARRAINHIDPSIVLTYLEDVIKVYDECMQNAYSAHNFCDNYMRFSYLGMLKDTATLAELKQKEAEE